MKKKPRITIQREELLDGTFYTFFKVRFPGQGWRNRLCGSWEDALIAAGVIRIRKSK